MTEAGWTLVTKKERKSRPVVTRHLSYADAMTLQKSLDIVGLAQLLTSVESKNLQADGWKFDRVLKGDGNQEEPVPEDTEVMCYTWLPVGNKWNDRALFSASAKELGA